MRKITLLALIGGLFTLVSAQKEKNQVDKDWYLQPTSKHVNGIDLDKAYEFLKDKKPKPIIVAVIDGGTDINHEDLVNVLWHNQGEIPFNGVDDDQNGYIDDTVGWNFIGGADGGMVGPDNLEKTRLLRKLNKQFAGSLSADDLNDPVRRKQYELYQSLKRDINENYARVNQSYENLKKTKDKLDELTNATGKKEPTSQDYLEEINKGDYGKMGEAIKDILKSGEKFSALYNQIKGSYEYYKNQTYNYDVNFDPRNIVGDDYDNPNDRNYGNNNVAGPDAGHGTHVAGIIAAQRGNDKGMDGVSNAAKIMVVRVVPNGDERDKDVANGIRYAVDNGARVINMSFGKSFSWDKAAVNEAVKYAADKGVLLVHAAGNDNKDNDENPNYPNDSLGNNTFAANWLEIGASQLECKKLPTDFSNYGKNQVDIFAPGYQIYSSTPDNNYEFFNGTSMAAPVTAGLAALIWSYYPSLTAVQVKQVIMESGITHKNKVPVPNDGEKGPKTKFTNLSVSGKVINAYKAVQLADKMVNK
jgi:cell wall-associated protease